LAGDDVNLAETALKIALYYVIAAFRKKIRGYLFSNSTPMSSAVVVLSFKDLRKKLLYSGSFQLRFS
jgi:hypothetical protein